MAIPDPLATDWVPIWNPVGAGPTGPQGPQGVPGTPGTITGIWTAVTFNAANYLATGGGGGTFTVPNQYNEQYTIANKMMTYAFYLQGTITGTPLVISIKLPAGITSNKSSGAPFNFGASIGQAAVSPGGASIDLYVNATGATNWTAGTYFLVGTFTFSIN